jgi:asparagine synthase (glutamine-hydrolysing)
LGVRALFYARRGDLWLISDSLDWLAAQWPRRPDLDEYWIGDFLTLGHSREFRRTVYRDIHRVPPGHCLQLDERDNSLRRYWQLEIAEPLHLKHAGEYAERFRELMAEAISDRLPKGTVGIAMSGGIDSTSLAALSIELKKDASQVVAECIHYKRLMNVGEDRYARLAARDIGIDLVVRPFDDLVYDQSWRSRGIAAAEPTQSLLDAHHLRAFGQERSRRAVIWFEGEGPDNALDLERDAYLKWLWRRREWVRFGAACVQYAFVKGASGWRQTLNRHVTRSMSAPRLTDIPRWLQREFVHDLDLQQRIENLGAGGMPGHPWHPVAISSFTSPVLQGYFGDCDFQESLAPIVHRHPYLDVRVVEFMLRVPPIPWGWKKRLMRVAMRGRLPREVLEREKTPLPLHPDVAAAREQGLGELVNRDGLQRYVDPARLPDVHAAPPEVRGLFAVHALDGWLSEREGSTLRRDAISAILET